MWAGGRARRAGRGRGGPAAAGRSGGGRPSARAAGTGGRARPRTSTGPAARGPPDRARRRPAPPQPAPGPGPRGCGAARARGRGPARPALARTRRPVSPARRRRRRGPDFLRAPPLCSRPGRAGARAARPEWRRWSRKWPRAAWAGRARAGGCGPPVPASLMTLERRPAGRRGPGWGGGARPGRGEGAPAPGASRGLPGRLASAARCTGGARGP